jgi:hypothetical protein
VGNTQSHYNLEDNSLLSVYVGLDSAQSVPFSEKDFIGARSLVEGYPDLMIDSVKVYPLGVLYDMEVFYTASSNTDSVYSYISKDSVTSQFHGLPISFKNWSWGYKTIITDFPLFFMDEERSKLLVQVLMEIFEEPLSIKDHELVQIPISYSLYQNYPNPFNPMTTIRFDIPITATGKQHTTLTVFDVRGRQVKTLVNSKLEPGNYQIVWDGKNGSGEIVASGVYFYTIRTGDHIATRKMTVVR